MRTSTDKQASFAYAVNVAAFLLTNSCTLNGPCLAIQLYLEAHAPSVFHRTKDHVQIAAVKPEHNHPGCRFESATLGAGVPRSVESPLI
jgi:hypothetical protein